MKTEHDCERCGIHVVHALPVPDDTVYCLACRFIESIDDPAVKRQCAEALDRHSPMFQDGAGECESLAPEGPPPMKASQESCPNCGVEHYEAIPSGEDYIVRCLGCGYTWRERP